MSETRQLRADLDRIVRGAIAAAAPGPLVQATLAGHELPDRVHALAVGKAALPMLHAAATALGDRMAAALAVAPAADPYAWPCTTPLVLRADHPVPGALSLHAGAEVLRFLEPLTADDTLLVLLSGGASALITQPAPGLTLQDLARTTRLLLAAGADIHALNCVRKHLDGVKGGRLARAASPARVLCLALSDVPGDDPAVIGSGPFTADPGTFADARAVLMEHGVWAEVPGSVRTHLEAARDESEKAVANVAWEMIGSNATALAAAAALARELGYDVHVEGGALCGEARRMGETVGSRLLSLPEGSALVLGGETTVTVRGRGQGGRSQELALAAAAVLEGTDCRALAAAGTDGVDGNSPAAGAIVDHTTTLRLRLLGIQPDAVLAQNDSYPALAAVGDALITGPTGTNVMDLVVALRATGAA